MTETQKFFVRIISGGALMCAGFGGFPLSLVCCLIDFGIAQFGLLTLVQKAYSTLAYMEIPVILIPYIIHMIHSAASRKTA